jgi:hypothetical protein
MSVSIPSVTIATGHTGRSTHVNELGMRPMQEQAYKFRGEQFLLIKSPPASGKSRALMYIALDKLTNQGVKQALIVVPERSIGSSFSDEPLSANGFWADWTVKPRWNLCAMPGAEDDRAAKGKVKAVGEFLQGEDAALVCTHATFRFAVEALGPEAFDGRLIAIDEFHHISINETNVLGAQLKELLAREKVHIVAMTGSYFRGDAAGILSPEDEARFATVTYTYYEQLNGYQYLKSLDIGYWFYSGSYLEAIHEVLDPALKTIIHIPSVNSSASTRDGKNEEVNAIMGALGEWTGRDAATDFHLIRQKDTGRVLKVADLVDDSDTNRRSKVLAALRDPAHKNDRDHVDVIIALGMAKEGFDWIWCEHALTVGYRNSLTEIVQIIGRVTRDAPGKPRAKFTNLVAEPMAAQSDVVEAVNDTLKAIAASLLMEQVIAPRFDFTPKDSGAKLGFDYGADGYKDGETNVGVNEETGTISIEIKGLKEMSPEAARICREDLNDVIAAVVQDKETLSRGLFDGENTVPQETTQLRIPKIIRDRYPELTEEDVEAVRQRAVAALTLVQTAVKTEEKVNSNLGLLEGVRRFVLHVRELSVDLIDSINPFGEAYAVLARTLNADILRQMQEKIAAKRVSIPEEEALALTRRALDWKKERGRAPQITSADAWERTLAEGVAAYQQHIARKKAKAAGVTA